ncbi:MAG: dUTP diphosphatase [Firmicutes bacterium]|nr:dUTP diphosphatase [Bacillota bacterium]MBQ1715887.1 dUTP diphosphatase [Bacillota bacterium]MBQ1825636.1 dUTP diphosphatase [Bacillota bacterium]MBQ2304956.1 dUTP diphosphatase [Bacillota bacterium]MBR2748445.1 dUTP diphosphatase [Bacillota bacterium]
MLIKVSSKNGNLPVYQTEGSAGADLKACLDEPITLMPGERRLIPTGMRIELPEGVEAQIRARSGLSIKHGITMINGVGTVDSDYRGEWNVPMVNLGSEPYTIHDGDRIAQAVFARYERAEFTLVETVNETERGGGGFGSTGK